MLDLVAAKTVLIVVLMILGFILVAVSINAQGIVEGQALDYYTGEYECWKNSVLYKEEAPLGVSYVCIEDAVEDNEWKLD